MAWVEPVTVSNGSPSTNSFQYANRENDGTGLCFNRARYYNPSIGRFISEDPIQFMGGPNFYAYVGDNPTNLIDPRGLGSQVPPGRNCGKDCRAQMRSRPEDITSIPIGGKRYGATHAWWYVTDDQGQDFTISFTATPGFGGKEGKSSR